MQYVSTRGGGGALPFEEILLSGLAPDGGLYVPTEYPHFSAGDIRQLQGKSYSEIAVALLRPFVDGIEEVAFRDIVAEAYGTFRHQAVAPLRQLGADQWLLELSHGPTLAFKDVAMQLLCRLFDVYLERRQQRLLIIGATSGDTGAAAVQACQGRSAIDLAMMHPLNRVSDIQRRQMTTVSAENILNLALTGNFDDCQAIAKKLLNDPEIHRRYRVSAVNSINWARVMAQVVYYFSAALQLGAPDRAPTFIVPSGNFGNIYAGFVAWQMGLPINKLVVATNRNDILHRFLQTGEYKVASVLPTQSPSMDIQVSSNFERFLFELSGRQPAQVTTWMRSLAEDGGFSVSENLRRQAARWFSSYSVDESATTAAIARAWQDHGFLIDPHTATGMDALAQSEKDDTIAPGPKIVLSTADPAKFPDAVMKATGQHPELPPEFKDIQDRDEYVHEVDNAADAVAAQIHRHMSARETLAIDNRIRKW